MPRTMTAQVKKFERLCVREHAKLRVGKRGLKRQQYGRYPYGFHLRGVWEIGMYYGFRSIDDQILRLGHDLDEDTNVLHAAKISAGASAKALRYIWCLTDEVGATRKERKAKTYRKIALYPSTVACKLADRMRNLFQGFIEQDNWSFAMYSDEQAEFEVGIGKRNDIRLRRMWRDLHWIFDHADELQATVPYGNVPTGAPGWMKAIVQESCTSRAMVP